MNINAGTKPKWSIKQLHSGMKLGSRGESLNWKWQLKSAENCKACNCSCRPFRTLKWKTLYSHLFQVENKHPDEVGKDSHTGTKGKMLREERKAERRSPFSLCDLHIKEPDEQLSRHGKGASASFSSTERHMEGFEAHI